MKLEKFPVIAPDGTEYRVTIEENSWLYYTYEVFVYEVRNDARWFRFKKIHNVTYRNNDGQKASGDDLIKFASRAVSEYLSKRKRLYEAADGYRTAVDNFRKWDGKITNKPEVSE